MNLVYARDRTHFITTNSCETVDWRVWLWSEFRHPTGLHEVSQRAESHGLVAHPPNPVRWVTSYPQGCGRAPVPGVFVIMTGAICPAVHALHLPQIDFLSIHSDLGNQTYYFTERQGSKPIPRLPFLSSLLGMFSSHLCWYN